MNRNEALKTVLLIAKQLSSLHDLIEILATKTLMFNLSEENGRLLNETVVKLTQMHDNLNNDLREEYKK